MSAKMTDKELEAKILELNEEGLDQVIGALIEYKQNCPEDLFVEYQCQCSQDAIEMFNLADSLQELIDARKLIASYQKAIDNMVMSKLTGETDNE